MTHRRVLWLFDGDHVGHPFVRLAAETMAGWGWQVTVADRASRTARGSYVHAPNPSGTSAIRRFAALWRGASGRTADLVLTTLPLAGLVARLRHPRARLVYWPFELLGEQPGRVSAPILALERWLLRHAVAAVITQNDCRARVYAEERGARVEPVIVRNFKPPVPSIEDTGELRAATGVGPDVRLVLYEGALVDGRWLDRLVDAVAALPPDAHLVFLGPPTQWWTETILPRIAASPERARIHVLPAVEHAALPRLVAGAECGLIIYDDRVRNNVYCEPGKLSDYLHAGVPVVAPAYPTIAPLIVGRGLGETFPDGSAPAIAAAIRRVLDRGRASYRLALQRSSAELTWDSQLPALRRALEGNPPRT